MSEPARLPVALAGAALAVAAALAGCLDSDTFALIDAWASAESAPPGLAVTASVRSDGDLLRIAAHAQNDGAADWSVPGSCAQPGGSGTEPWSVAARGSRPYDRPLPIYPEEGCSGVTLKPFRPGDSDAAAFTWDGSYRFEDGFAHAGPGTYRLEVVLELYEAGSHEPRPAVVPFEVRVLR